MICQNCGQHISDDVNFCSHCGAAIPKDVVNSFCPACGTQLSPEERFCHACGNRVDASSASAQKPVVKQLDTMKFASMYVGEPKMAYSAATGTLFVYTNRLEFQKKKGSALSSRSEFMGKIVDALMEIDPITTYPLNEIIDILKPYMPPRITTDKS